MADWGGKSLAGAVETAKKTLQDVTGFVRDGQAADMILRVAEEQHADVIVLGRRGLTGLERFLLGGVSSAVVNHSKCDILIVK